MILLALCRHIAFSPHWAANLTEQRVSLSGGYGERICPIHPTHTPSLWREFSTPSLRESRGVSWHAHGLVCRVSLPSWDVGFVEAWSQLQEFQQHSKSGHQQHCPLIWQRTRSDSSNRASTPRILNISILVKGCRKRLYLHYKSKTNCGTFFFGNLHITCLTLSTNCVD